MFSEEYIRHYKETLKLAFPIIMSQLSHIVIMITDNIVVGRYHTDALAAASLANGIMITVMLFGLGITFGITPLVAAAEATKKYHECVKLLRHGSLLYLLISLGLFLVVFLTSLFLEYFGQPPHVTELARPFLVLQGISMVPSLIFQCLKQFMEGTSNPREPMYVAMGGEVINVLLNIILVFGWMGAPELGLLGAGIGTLVAKTLMAVAVVVVFFRMKKFDIYAKHIHWKIFSGKVFKKLLKMGMPIGMQMVFEGGAVTCTTIMMGWLGAKVLAAHQIALSISAVTFMVAAGIGSAASIRTANQKGLRNKYRLQMAGKSAILIVVIFMTVCSMAVVATRFVLPTFYVQDQEVWQIASMLLVMVAIFQVSDGVQVVAINTLRGIQDVKVPTIITLIAYWLVGIPLSYVMGFVFNFGAEGVWSGLIISLTVAAVLLTIRFLKRSRQMVV